MGGNNRNIGILSASGDQDTTLREIDRVSTNKTAIASHALHPSQPVRTKAIADMSSFVNYCLSMAWEWNKGAADPASPPGC